MKIKKILAAIAASAMVLTMFGATVYAAGVEGDDDIIDEDVTDIDENEDEDEDEVEVEVEVEVEDEVAVPKTGNSAVAFAVIPVALAAAAIIAKKSK